MSNERGLNLRSLFEETRSKAERLLVSSRPASEELNSVLRSLHTCMEFVASLEIFGMNECLEEVQTSQLNYFLIPYYIGLLTCKNPKPERKDTLREAARVLEEFFALLNNYNIFPNSLRAHLEKCISGNCANPSETRAAKIEMYNKIKTLEEDTTLLKERVEKTNCDEELLRRYLTSNILLCANKALRELANIQREENILKLKEKYEKCENPEKKHENPEIDYTRNLETHIPNLKNIGIPNVTILSNNPAKIKQNAFKWGLSLPTMTVDEFLDRNLQKITATKEPENITEIDDNDYEAQDRQTMKDRLWDDYKDTNPRGWGNRYNKG